MSMESYPHTLVAIYPDSGSADVAKYRLSYAGLGDVRFVHVHADSPYLHTGGAAQKDQGSEFLHTLLAGDAAAVNDPADASSPSLFVSEPAVAPLVEAGYGAALGTAAGAAMGLKPGQDLVAGLLQDAVGKGFHVLVVHAPDAVTEARAERAVADTLVENGACA